MTNKHRSGRKKNAGNKGASRSSKHQVNGPSLNAVATPVVKPDGVVRLSGAADLIALQRTVGNQAVGRLLAGGAISALRVGSETSVQRAPSRFFINNGKAYIRSEPDMKSTGKVIPRNKVVEIAQTKEHKGKTYVRVQEILPDGFIGPPMGWDWTIKSNLSPLDQAAKFKLSSAKIKGTSTSTRDFAAKVVKKAGKDPDTWFSNFKNTTFLGRLIHPPIHEELVQHLKSVEAKLVAKHGGPLKDPEVAGQKLGMAPDMETIKGSRRKATSAARSMHFFGLAIDIEYSKNPYITESASDKKATAAVLPRASLLVEGKKSSFVKEKNADVDKVLKLDKLLETYFSYLDDANRDALQARLDAAKAKGTKTWKNKTITSARKQIKSDLKKVASAWGRSTKTVKKEGFTNLSKELIVGLDLHWGAAYGDLMHFDMRNKGTGEKIDQFRR